jgi:dihydroorotase
MLKIINAVDIHGVSQTFSFNGSADFVFDAQGLTVLPGLIDPHVHFRTPGMEHKENWLTAAKAALRGGYTTVFDMPNTIPPTITEQFLKEKKLLIDAQLQEVNIPLRYELFFGADKKHFSEIHKIKQDVIGIKVFMGCSTGNLVVDDDESLHAVFAIAASQNLLIAVHAEDEQLIQQRKAQFHDAKNYADHSHIRNPEVAARAVEKAISLTRIYGTRLYILHTSTADEIELIAKAKKAGLPVFAETTPHHLFLNDSAYENLHGKAVVNPPLRTERHREILFAAIHDGIIDTIGSDHAPHTEQEKSQIYGMCPSGMPGIETMLPLLLNAHHEGFISLEKIISLTCERAREIFSLAKNTDLVLVDLHKKQKVDNSELKTKCGWSAFAGVSLQGWPTHVVLRDQLYDLTLV